MSNTVRMADSNETAAAYAAAIASAVRAFAESGTAPAIQVAQICLSLIEQLDLAAEKTGTRDAVGASQRALTALARACHDSFMDAQREAAAKVLAMGD